MRRVIVEVGDLSTALPCEVVYWKDTEAPGVRRVLWNARTDASYCDAKAAGLVDKLAGAGWNCSNDGQAAAAAAAPAPAAPATPSAAASNATPSEAGTASTSNEQGFDAATVARVQPTLPAAEAPSAGGNALAATPSAPAPAAEAQANTDLQTAAVAPDTPAASFGDVDQLQTVIQANLSSLNQSVDG
ncbi:MAG: hypothetical protein ACR2RE_01180, partial [Geminicoccaceae bacterium]